jgi:hypothetical protein
VQTSSFFGGIGMKAVNIDPVKFWNEAMKDNFKDPVKIKKPVTVTEEVEPVEETISTEEDLKKKRSEHAKRSMATLLAKNPNHFKELSRKGHEKKRLKLLNEAA